MLKTVVAPTPKGRVLLVDSIGDSQDMWDNGVISHANALAIDAGLKPGLCIKDALLAAIAATEAR